MINFILKGNVTRTVEFAISEKGVTYARIGIASDEYDSKGQKIEGKTSFVTVTVFGERAERSANELAKGDFIQVEGRVQTKMRMVDGEAVWNTDLYGDAITLLRKKPEPVAPEPKAKKAKAKKAA